MVQDRCVRQRLDRGHSHECRKFQIDDAKLIAVATAYALLRHNGVDLGKKDYLGPS